MGLLALINPCSHPGDVHMPYCVVPQGARNMHSGIGVAKFSVSLQHCQQQLVGSRLQPPAALINDTGSAVLVGLCMRSCPVYVVSYL